MTTARLSRASRLLIAGDALSSLGTGLVLPLTLVYLHQVRGISLPVVGALLAGSAATGLVAVPLSGVAIDHFGARNVFIAVLSVLAVSQVGLAWAHNVPSAVPALLLQGASMGPTFPAFASMMAGICPDPTKQQRAFAVNFTGVNIGVGIGGALGAAVVDVHHPFSFQSLFLANAVSCVLFALVLTRLPNVRKRREPGSPAAGYREVLSRPALRTVIVATLVLAFTGYAALDSGLPAYGTVEAHVSVHVIALSVTVNTAVIVGAQLFVLRVLRVLRRSRALAVIGLIWAASWAIFGLSALPLPAGLRITCVMTFMALFGLGETFMAPTVSPLVNSLSDERIRGRANALSSATYSAAFVVSPAISTGLIALGLATVWISLLCAGCLATVLLGISLGRRLRDEQDRVESGALPEPVSA